MIKTFLQIFFTRQAYQLSHGSRLFNIMCGLHDIYSGLITVFSLGSIYCSTNLEYVFAESKRKHFEKIEKSKQLVLDRE